MIYIEDQISCKSVECGDAKSGVVKVGDEDIGVKLLNGCLTQ